MTSVYSYMPTFMYVCIDIYTHAELKAYISGLSAHSVFFTLTLRSQNKSANCNLLFLFELQQNDFNL